LIGAGDDVSGFTPLRAIHVASQVDHGGDSQQEREMRVELLSLGLVAALMSTTASAEIRVVSQTPNNLHQQLDEPLRPGTPARTRADVELLQKYRDRTNADIFALQEVNGPRAAQLVFPADQWICSSLVATPMISSPVGKATGLHWLRGPARCV
jgi:hypothetical protein